MQVEVIKMPECWLCNDIIDFRDEVEMILDEPQYDAVIVDGVAKQVVITARYFCSDAHANEYKQWLDSHKLVSTGKLKG